MKLSKSYEPQAYEKDIYALWEKSQAFTPSRASAKDSFCVVMPPPNANGNLHIGHAFSTALEDIATRYQRLQGKQALFLPGADHAGFETQVVYEKQLELQGKSRFDFTREELYRQVWDFVQLNKSNFEGQLRAIGAGVDWTRYTFTLDEKVVKTAYATFKKMWEEKLIYRGERLVNFCTFHGTAFADIEVEFKDVQGHLWHIKYPLTDGSGEIIVATTRPETMLGDTAVAVHPDDERYKHMQGKTIRLPLTGREIPIVADTMVAMDFGSGAVKITPAHDPNDFEVGKKHDMPMITVINYEGKIAHESIPERFHDLTVGQAREAVVAELEKGNYLDKIEDYTHSVGHCYKCGTVIEPLLRDQWFIAMPKLALPAIEALKAGQIEFSPAAKQAQAVNYLENVRDWNISRQIAWGIPIPAFQNVDNPDDWIYDEQVTEEFIKVGNHTYRRDPDVFDTWFSSGHWPLATLGYPDGPDFDQFYPNSVIETGADILYQWVCRMIMIGLYVTGKVPFVRVYLHGLVLDEHGAKMSKSKGNVINPMEIIDEYGSDALRIGVILGQTAGNNQPFSVAKVTAGRNFCNKLWNIARYVEGVLGDDFDKHRSPKAESAADHWMLNKLQHTAEVVADALENYRFADGFDQVYHLIWDDLADWYIEASKTDVNKGFLAYVLESVLVMTHPFAPFVTETIWQTLAWENNTMIVASSWPKPPKADKARAKVFEEIILIVSEARLILGALAVQKPNLYYHSVPFLAENAKIISRLAKLKNVLEVESGRGLNLTSTKYHCWLDIDNATAEHYRSKLEILLQEQEVSKSRLQGRLGNKEYVKNAPKKVVEETEEQLKSAEAQILKLTAELERFVSATQDL